MVHFTSAFYTWYNPPTAQAWEQGRKPRPINASEPPVYAVLGGSFNCFRLSRSL